MAAILRGVRGGISTLLSVLLASAAIAGCDPGYTVCVHVRRCSDGDPLAGVKVTTHFSSDHRHHGYTDSDGEYCETNLGQSEPPDEIRITFSKYEYETLTHTFVDASTNLPWVCLAGPCDPSAGDACDGAAGAAGMPAN